MKAVHPLLLAAAVAGAGLWPSAAQAATSITGNFTYNNGNDATLISNDTLTVKWENGRVLIVRDDGKEIFASNAATNTTSLTFSNGNLRVHTWYGAVRWKTDTAGSGATTLMVDGCEVKLTDGGSNTLWSYKEDGCYDTTVPMSGACRNMSQYGTIVSNENAYLSWEASDDGYGRLALRSAKDDSMPWSTTYTGRSATKVCFQGDGNLVLYKDGGIPVWATMTFGQNLTLKLEATGNFRIGTEQSVSYSPIADFGYVPSTLTNTGDLKSGSWCRARNAPANIVQSGDTRLSWEMGYLWLGFTNGSVNSNFNSTQGSWLCHQSDGNLVVYDSSMNALWASGTYDSNYASTIEAAACKVEMKHAGSVKKTWYVSPTCGETTNGNGFTYIFEESAGNKKFAASFWAVAAGMDADSLSAVQSKASGTALSGAIGNTSTASNFAKTLGNAGATITLFGSTKSIFEGDAYITNESGYDARYVGIDVFGQTKMSASNTFSQTYSAPEVTFLSADQQFVILFVPLTVTAQATGTLSATLSLGYEGAWVATITPDAELTASLSAGFGGAGLSGGFYGTLTLLNVAVPCKAKLSTSTKEYEASISLDIRSLDGEVGIYAEALGKRAEKSLFDWEGVSFNKTLFNRNGKL